MFDLAPLTDPSLLFLRVMAGAIYADSGYSDLKAPDARSKDLGVPRGFTIFLGAAEIAGGAALVLGVFQQLAAIGDKSPGWYYELTLISMLAVIIATDGGSFVLLR